MFYVEYCYNELVDNNTDGARLLHFNVVEYMS